MTGGGSGESGGGDHDAVGSLVRQLGDSARRANAAELARVRGFYGDRIPSPPADLAIGTPAGRYLLRKYDEHVMEIEEWPTGTTPEEYAESLRAT
jgi:hypothetical protein